MKKQLILAGYLLMFAALTFWISWFLMPDPGTTDTGHILKIVKNSRTSVLYSVIIQITSSVLYLLSLFLLARIIIPKKLTLIGIVLLGIGTLGLCSDAFFHLLAWFMTSDSVNIQEDVVRVMDFMQTQGIVFLIPILLPFFIGSLVLAIRLNKQAIISKKSGLIFIIALLTILISELVMNKILMYKIPGLTLTALGLFATGQALIGVELVVASKKQATLTTQKK